MKIFLQEFLFNTSAHFWRTQVARLGDYREGPQITHLKQKMKIHKLDLTPFVFFAIITLWFKIKFRKEALYEQIV